MSEGFAERIAFPEESVRQKVAKDWRPVLAAPAVGSAFRDGARRNLAPGCLDGGHFAVFL